MSSPHDLDPDHAGDWVTVLSDADGNVVLGAFPSQRGDKWCWTIPHRSDTPELWLTVAMDTCRAANPGSFPEIDPWRVRKPWMTIAERDARAELEQLREERRRADEVFRQRELVLEAAFVGVAQQAERGERRLLTAQGDELVDAVKTVLKKLGFNVEDIDEIRLGEGLPRAEDLQITCPDRPTLRVIAEVKGYARGGAKASDLIQLGQHALRYAQRERRAPDGSWYIVNQFAATDPDARQPPLAGATEDVQVFAEGVDSSSTPASCSSFPKWSRAGGSCLSGRGRNSWSSGAVFTCPAAMTT